MKKKTSLKTEVCKTNFTIVFQQWSVSILSLDLKKEKKEKGKNVCEELVSLKGYGRHGAHVWGPDAVEGVGQMSPSWEKNTTLFLKVLFSLFSKKWKKRQ